MERNIRLYPVYQAARSTAFWLPVFFLYFSSRFGAAQVLELEALYYLGVVILEVPSGYLSDRLGRRPTLIVSTLAWTLGYGALAAGGSWEVFAAGQVAIAAGMAFNSGTDSALLHDSLSVLGRERELVQIEGRAQAWGLTSMAISALVGGLLATVDLRLGHGLSAVGAIVALGLAFSFVEPPGERLAQRPLAQLGAVAHSLRQPGLRWVFVFAVAMTVFNHVPYELAQPYLDLVLTGRGVGTFTPAASGLMMALMMGLASLASRFSAPVGRRVGVAAVLLGAMVLQGIVLTGLALAVHPLVVVLLLARSIPGAVANPLSLHCVLPRLDSGLKATYLSVQSLAGRLAFAGALAGGAHWVGGMEGLDAAAIARLSTAALALLIVVGACLALFRRALSQEQ